MANTYTPNVQLAMPAPGDRTWNVPVNGNAQVLDALAPVGALAVVTTEVPSATLNVHVAAGNYVKQDGTIGTYAGSVSQAMTASATNYLYLDLTNSGALVVNTSGFPTTAHVRLATVVAGATTITSITDARVAFHVIGSFADGVNLTFGTATGTQIGTAANQKLAFFGKTPVVQPTLGAATAGTSYTTNEQTMLNAVYAAVETAGPGKLMDTGSNSVRCTTMLGADRLVLAENVRPFGLGYQPYRSQRPWPLKVPPPKPRRTLNSLRSKATPCCAS